jgi:hypothetical protein
MGFRNPVAAPVPPSAADIGSAVGSSVKADGLPSTQVVDTQLDTLGVPGVPRASVLLNAVTLVNGGHQTVSIVGYSELIISFTPTGTNTDRLVCDQSATSATGNPTTDNEEFWTSVTQNGAAVFSYRWSVSGDTLDIRALLSGAGANTNVTVIGTNRFPIKRLDARQNNGIPDKWTMQNQSIIAAQTVLLNNDTYSTGIHGECTGYFFVSSQTITGTYEAVFPDNTVVTLAITGEMNNRPGTNNGKVLTKTVALSPGYQIQFHCLGTGDTASGSLILVPSL